LNAGRFPEEKDHTPPPAERILRMRTGHKLPFRPNVECLEGRTLLASHLSASLSGGLLRIEGTNHADHIVVSQDGGRISVQGTDIRAGGRMQESVSAAAVRKVEVFGQGGDDTIDLRGRAHDPLRVSATVWGGDGNDTIWGGAGNDKLYGGAGNDVIHGGAGKDLIDGGAGNDRLIAGTGNDVLIGGPGNDVLVGGPGNLLDGGNGRNVLDGRAGHEVIISRSVADVILGAPGDKIIRTYHTPAARHHEHHTPTVRHQARHAVRGAGHGVTRTHHAPAPAVHPHALEVLADHPQSGMAVGTPQPGVASSAWQSQVTRLLDHINDYRLSHGLPALTVNADLTASAQYQASYMARTGHYSHVDLDGRTLGDRVDATGYTWHWVGESIHRFVPSIARTLGIDRLYSRAQLAEYCFDGWRVSREHNEIMLSPQARDVGIAIAMSPSGLVYAVADFGHP
jgi:uncharacterized protein YkwD